MARKSFDNSKRANGDAFLAAAELPALYSDAESFRATATELRQRFATSDLATRARVTLAIIYATRVHSGGPVDERLAEISKLEAQLPADSEFQLLARLVRSVVMLTCAEQYEDGLAILNSLHDELRFTTCGELYGLICRWMGLALMGVGKHDEAQAAFADAVSICRRYGMQFTHAAALNDYAVLKRRCGRYPEARRMFHDVIREFTALGAQRNVLLAVVNLGNVAIRTGNWHEAEKQFMRAEKLLAADGSAASVRSDARLQSLCTLNANYILLLRRRFGQAEERLRKVLEQQGDRGGVPRALALAHEFLGEIYIETERSDEAETQLRLAEDIARSQFPDSDVMTEILRRRAELCKVQGSLVEARDIAIRCMRLCLRIDDPCELGAVERVLGDTYVAIGENGRQHPVTALPSRPFAAYMNATNSCVPSTRKVSSC